MKPIRLPALLLLTIVSPAVLAAELDEREYEEPAPWTEDVKVLPPQPQESDLIVLELDGLQPAFKHYIDSKSVATYADGVVTYSVTIASDSGAKNIFFEGVRCDTGYYKIYAYGGSDGVFQKSQTASWQRIRSRGGATSYRSDLARYYLCDAAGRTLKPQQIIERLRHPKVIPSRNSTQ